MSARVRKCSRASRPAQRPARPTAAPPSSGDRAEQRDRPPSARAGARCPPATARDSGGSRRRARRIAAASIELRVSCGSSRDLADDLRPVGVAGRGRAAARPPGAITAGSDSRKPSANSAPASRIRARARRSRARARRAARATPGITSRGPQLQPPIHECHVAASTNVAANSAASSAAIARVAAPQRDERERHEHDRRREQHDRLLRRSSSPPAPSSSGVVKPGSTGGL